MQGTEPLSEQPIPNEFPKIIKDLVKDILITFPEYKDTLDEDLHRLVLSKNIDNLTPEEYASLNIIFEHCKQVFPERFFDILYQNADIFRDETINTQFLPGINFLDLWKTNITEKTKETLWKYLQLLLFTIIKHVNKDTSFGDTAKLFEAINEDEFKEKLSETINNVHNLFSDDNSENNNDSKEGESNPEFNLEDLPRPEEIHEHITGMLDGKLGKLAKEIAAETAEGLNVNLDESASVNDVFEKLFKNPGRLMTLVKSVGTKLDSKLKSGELKESELIEEAGELMNKMKNMPGMGNIQQMMNKMHGGKVNMGAFNSRMSQNLKHAKMKERMQETLRKRNEKAMNPTEAPPLFNPETVVHSAYTTGDVVTKTPINRDEAKKPNKKKKKKNKQKK